MTLSNLEVIRIVCRCNLYTASSKLLINVRVCDYRNLLINDWKQKHLAYNILIALVIWIYGNCSITKHSLRTCRCNLYKTTFLTYDRILDMPKMTFLLYMLNLGIWNRCLTNRTPVDDAASLINIAFFVQTDKYLLNSLRAALIHCKALSVPISRGT